MWLPLAHPLLGTWPATQACTLNGNWTGNTLICRPELNPLSHTSQGHGLLCNPVNIATIACILPEPSQKYWKGKGEQKFGFSCKLPSLFSLPHLISIFLLPKWFLIRIYMARATPSPLPSCFPYGWVGSESSGGREGRQ